jgi:hypothetical protein
VIEHRDRVTAKSPDVTATAQSRLEVCSEKFCDRAGIVDLMEKNF